MTNPCPFCEIAPDRIISQSDFMLTTFDQYPVSPGHTLIIPKRHVASLFALTETEWNEIFDELKRVKDELLTSHQPDGFNIGVNDGEAAGQTILHLHVHVIPRYEGDVADPRGGIRWLFPDHAKYWE